VAVLSDFYLPKGLPPETGEKRKENHVFSQLLSTGMTKAFSELYYPI
jgi:hypothetical protein